MVASRYRGGLQKFIICFSISFGRGYCPEGFQTITSYCTEGFLTITSYCPEPLSNVRKCWLAMPLGAGFLRWVLACRTIEKKTEVKFYFS